MINTISFELHAKIVEEINLEKCNFQNFRSSVTLILTLDPVEVILVGISGQGLPYTKLDRNQKNFLWTDGRMYGWMDGQTGVPIH